MCGLAVHDSTLAAAASRVHTNQRSAAHLGPPSTQPLARSASQRLARSHRRQAAPHRRTYEGKELRLKQQHFFVSATLQDVVRRFKESNGTDFALFHEKVAFQLNDTHPTIAVPELMRLLMDENSLGWTESWEITTKVCSLRGSAAG